LLSIIEQPADVQVWHIASLPGPPANVGSLGSSGNARRALKTRMTDAVEKVVWAVSLVVSLGLITDFDLVLAFRPFPAGTIG
jgi:hypothetical protein